MERVLHKARFAVAFTDRLKEQAETLLVCESKKIHVQPQGIETRVASHFSWRDFLHSTGVSTEKVEDLRVFLLVCGLRRVKDPLYLLEAFSEWHIQNPLVLLIIIGPKVSKGVSESLGVHPTGLTTADHCIHTSPEPPHLASSPPRSSETSHPDSCCNIGLHSQRISTQTVRNRLREAHLHACRPDRGLDLTAVHRRNQLECANAHIRWRLALWRGVLLTDESRFSLYRADGRQRVWCQPCGSSGPWGRWGYGMGRHMLWTMNTGAYCDEILRLIVVPFIHIHHLMLQHDNPQPHVARISSQFLESGSCMASIITCHVTH
ncbi:uncharacterized protein glt1d1 isoform X4 [Triplophysa dalaica]|nr:uncharacterized protein glt1d1 isoform X4 [Triplophysa dalaica]